MVPRFAFSTRGAAQNRSVRPAGSSSANDTLFEGYTGGSRKQVLDGFMETGDIGNLDGKGRLYIDGRADDMIVSGGKNVYPGEVERLLATHPSVLEVAVVGCPSSVSDCRPSLS